MKKKLKTLLITIPFLAAGCTGNIQESDSLNLTQYVDTHIGSAAHGHVFVGANVPWGFIQLGPTSIPQLWDWTSGYHATDSTVIGFPHTHLSGTGIGDLHDVTVMPVIGEVTYARGVEDDPKSGLWSYADRTTEVSKPGYYAVHLNRYNVDVELTATSRVGFHKYTFKELNNPSIVFDLENGGCWDKATEASIKRLNETTLVGYRYSKGWATDQRIFFVAELSQPITKLDVIADANSVVDSNKGEKVYARAAVDAKVGEPVYMKVAVSPTSIDNAIKNMKAELPGWDFQQTIADADDAWNKSLAKIEMETADRKNKTIFYTALYHTMIAPSEFCDVDGSYYGADHQMHSNDGFVNHTTLSCWDTYRSAHPLMSLIHPDKMPDMMQTFVQIYKQQGKLPVWHLMGCETNCMVGNPGVCIVADGLVKGYIKDEEAAYEALKNSVMLDERGMKYRKEYGFIPYDKMKESVACDMEYAIADWAVAQAAKKLGKTEDYKYFSNRSRSYQHFFDKETSFVRGRGTKGEFHTPFNPFASTHRYDDYCEGNAWQYTFLVPHDFKGLVDCFGSEAALVNKLDSLFAADSNLGKGSSPDISGLIGQYAHGNEPSHHIIYFYTMAGQPGKTADRVREVMTTLYTDQKDGLSGNEDVGAMSAWYVLSSLGFYQVEPAGGRYFFGSPMVDKAVLKVRDGEFTIIANGNSATNKYIQSIKLNGQPYQKEWIDFEDIAKGGTLEYTMGATPTCWYR